MDLDSEIVKFYKNKSVFLTGATGFVGKAILEKLLRSCSQIRCIYVLVRSKSGSDVQSRLQELLEDPIFSSIRESGSDAFSKVSAVQGDVVHPHLGMNKEDYSMVMESVEIIIHSAALIKFNENLKTALRFNVGGVKRVLHLAGETAKLEALVYVSTAYSNCDKPGNQETVNPAPVDPDALVQLVESMDEDTVRAITPHLLRGKPNTYTYTKALAESIVEEAGKALPICIVRPSMVLGAFEAPIPGWSSGSYGINAGLLAIGAGLYRNILSRPGLVADFVPVDFVANCVVVASWYTAKHGSGGTTTVYNCCSGSLNPVYWGDFQKFILENSRKHALSAVKLYPKLSLDSNIWWYTAKILFFNWVPVYVMDEFLKLFGQRPQYVKKYSKIRDLSSSYEFFTNHEWKFPSDNLVRLQEKMTPMDKAKFNIDLRRIDWDPYFENFWLGLRKYVAKDVEPNISTTKNRLLRFIFGEVAALFGFITHVQNFLTGITLKWMGRLPLITMLLLLPVGAGIIGVPRKCD